MKIDANYIILILINRNITIELHRRGTYSTIQYSTAHEDWDVTGYQGLFCPLNKPTAVTGYRGGVYVCMYHMYIQLVKAGGRRVLVS